MISIQRPPVPDFILDTSGKWHKETLLAITYYASGTPAKAFKFEAYKDARLKAELKKVFTKCAYCESNYDNVYDGDIEHFRPKGQVNEKDPKNPGYYWLANDWDNLLLSCQHCNQKRQHNLYGEEILKTHGKLDQFPLSDESKRVTSHLNSIIQEEEFRLLLHPCKDKPEQHFKYEKNEAVIIPLTDKGRKSIDVYVLQRVHLVKERKKQLILLFRQMAVLKRELERFNDDKSPVQEQIFKEEMNNLMEFTKKEAQYSGMSIFFVREFLLANKLI